MKKYELNIHSICKVITSLSCLNTSFIDTDDNCIVNYVINDVPDLIRGYLENTVNHTFADNKQDLSYNATIYSNLYYMNFISAPIFKEEEYFGSIIAGPYLMEEPTSLMIQDIVLKTNMSISLRQTLKQYYKSLSILNEHKVEDITECLCGLIKALAAGTSEQFRIKSEHIKTLNRTDALLNNLKQNENLYLDIIKERYDKENEIICAVEKGDFDLAMHCLNKDTYSFKLFDRIPNDPLRSSKNICFVFNTLLRKAAENGGVHPIYLDDVSGKFATLIEKAISMQQLTELNVKILHEYCDLVNKLSLKQYSQFVQKVIEYIRLNIDKNLSLEVLAKVSDSSPTKISREFKSEVGESITNFINSLRINEAVQLMSNEKYNITDIAFKVGFNDLNYFTKVFKKFKGVTPSEYKKIKL